MQAEGGDCGPAALVPSWNQTRNSVARNLTSQGEDSHRRAAYWRTSAVVMSSAVAGVEPGRPSMPSSRDRVQWGSGSRGSSGWSGLVRRAPRERRAPRKTRCW